MRILFLPALLLVAACGSSGTTDAIADAPAAEDLFFATTEGDTSANGLSFAAGDVGLADANGEGPIQVKVVRALTDWDSGETRLVISEETLVVTDTDITEGNPDFTITLNGELITFSGQTSTETVNGGTWGRYLNSDGAVSGTGAFYDYAYGADPELTGEFDTEAFFVFGFETDPAEIVALMGDISYSGGFEGFGQLLNQDGTVFISEVFTEGQVELTVQFGSGAVNGTVVGGYLEPNDGEGYLGDIDMSFSTTVEGNGYAADLVCDAGCTDNSSIIAGGFFGVDALETSGVIGFDIGAPVADPDIVTDIRDTRFISGAGYTSEQIAPE